MREALRKDVGSDHNNQIDPISFSQTLGVGCWLALQTPVDGQVVLGGQVEATTVAMGGGSFHILAVIRSFKMIFKYAINPIKSTRFRAYRPLMLAGLHCRLQYLTRWCWEDRWG